MPRGTKRRGDGEGTIYEEGPGRWRAELTVDGKTIKRRAGSRKEAQERLKELRRQRDARLQVGTGRQSLRQWIGHWLTTIAPLQGLKPRTIAGHRDICDRYVLPYLGDIALEKLRIEDVESWLGKLAGARKGGGRPLSPSTIDNALRRLGTALQIAVERRIVAENVAQAARKRMRLPQREPAGRWLDAEQAAQLLESIAEHRLYALYALALTCGLRQAELIGLRWPNVRLLDDDPHLVVAEQLHRLKAEGEPARLHRERSTKTGKARQVPLPAALAAVLRAHKARQARERLALGEAWRGEDLVFTSEAGTPLDPSRLLRQLKAMLRRAGLPVTTFHALRHTAGSVMLAAGAQIVDVAEVLGHSSPLVTARIYAHSFSAGRRRAVEGAAAGLLRQAGG